MDPSTNSSTNTPQTNPIIEPIPEPALPEPINFESVVKTAPILPTTILLE